MTIYTVQPGDSVYSISRRFGVSPEAVIRDNQLANPSLLLVGQALVLPTDTIQHTVAAGETLYALSRRYGIPSEQIAAANPSLSNPALIYPGQVLTIPLTQPPSRSIDVNGYVFPNVSNAALQTILPNLTYISPFSYKVRADGTLVPLNEDRVIQSARQANTAPLMVITNILEGGSFNSDLARAILADESVQDNLLNQVIKTLQQKQYNGLDVDFEYIYPENKEDYNAFLRKTTERLHPMGYTVSTALAPKLSADQAGLLYEAHDYAAQGRIVDHIILMTYEWGYTYGPAQAVAPLNQVEKVLQYAVSVIPSQKILMGMPNYGYDWTLPFVQGSAARSLSNQQAIDQAASVHAQIEFDQTAQAPFYRYYDSDGKEHVVWFDDARSIQARLELVKKYNLGGVSYWTLNTYFRPNWVVLRSMYQVNKVL